GASVQPLPWEVRLNIAIGAARGLAFLHSSKDRVLIYRDIKAANILLDSASLGPSNPHSKNGLQNLAYNAKISDFGLAKLGPPESQSHVTTRVVGSYGYAAPEYLATGHLYVKSDVYGFGVVLVELLTGKRALDPARPNGQLSLVDWTKPFLSNKRKLKNIMDSRLEGRYPSKAATEIAALALKCISQEPRNRPSMQEVVTALERIQAAKEKPTEPEQQPSRLVAQQPLRHRSQLYPK
ncbi:putative serine/threonine-protein kinase PIX13, partial [Drosera capensis]